MRRAAVVLLLLALTACGSEGVETQPTPASGAPADPAAATRMFLLDDPDLDVRVLSGTDTSGTAQTVADAPVPETGMVEAPLRR